MVVIDVIVWEASEAASPEVIVVVDCVAEDESTTVEVRSDVRGALEGADPPIVVVGAEVEIRDVLAPVPRGMT